MSGYRMYIMLLYSISKVVCGSLTTRVCVMIINMMSMWKKFFFAINHYEFLAAADADDDESFSFFCL